MPVVLSEGTNQEISTRVDRLRTQYAGNPLVTRIDYRIGLDWSNEPAVFITVILPGRAIPVAELERLDEDLLGDLLGLVRTEEIGLSSYLSLANETGR